MLGAEAVWRSCPSQARFLFAGLGSSRPSAVPYACSRVPRGTAAKVSAAPVIHAPSTRQSSGRTFRASSAMAAMGDGAMEALKGDAPESTDFANYFCTYGFIYHQKDMLEDHKRTGAYYNAVMQNRRQFEGKVVLDVGTGSGILAIFAAKAGAKKVYAVEATDMAKSARTVVEANGLSDVITVIQGMVETVSLPEKVDIIISEWMGYFLLRESMLDSVLLARDRFLKPGGALYPSHCRMYFAPIRTNSASQRRNEYQHVMENWTDFEEEMRQLYGVDLSCLGAAYSKEQRDYYLDATAWQDVHPSQLIGIPRIFKTFDLHKVQIEDIQKTVSATCTLPIQESGNVEGLCAWFDSQFCGSEENPTDEEVILTTAPDATGATHWGQQTFFMQPPIAAKSGDSIRMKLEINRKKDNHRLMHVKMQMKLQGTSEHAVAAKEHTRMFHIE